MAEVVLQEIMGETTSGWLLGFWVGLVLSVMFMFMEACFTCDCIRKRMDESKSTQSGTKKNDQEMAFNCCRFLGSLGACCFFAPGAIVSFFGAILIIANQRGISFGASFIFCSWVWLYGWINAQVISVLILLAKFKYHTNYVELSYTEPSAV